MLKPLIESLKTKSRTIVFPEGTDKRILYSAEKLTADDLVGVILLASLTMSKQQQKSTVMISANVPLLILRLMRVWKRWYRR